ncbi:GntR family transcriptional regulator [Flavitalea sp. BT771]|uniref:GntR family transcriptional regulator n=1 Tax=Flavitalea sp. BT771 TaxID=3063329 RepID=UPI0026E25393|nr:GntR family transcriptional regulator [Flavitalea sp. BT771]MDO6435200.1 GntR family transcriptional regulator [Flavitalea sp. BT771]MDV6224095.1 GntR family transcriptional regulator [Flavitalea sp. BT771]
MRKGFKLPGSREMTVLFGIQRNTVLAAYEELLSQGWLQTFPKKGTYISGNLPEVAAVPLRKDGTPEHYPEKARFTAMGKYAGQSTGLIKTINSLEGTRDYSHVILTDPATKETVLFY